MTDPQPIPVETLFAEVAAIFQRVGVDPDPAASMARIITAGERDACKSHGIYRIAGLLRTIKAGKVTPNARPQVTVDDTALVRVAADGGFACLGFELALPRLVERARALGLAAMVITDCTHFAALWPEVEALADQGLAGLAMCPSYASVAPAGGTRALLGTNPFAFGWPRPGRDPYVFDFATSVVARGEIELHRREGRPIPEGWAIDAEGAPTTDPVQALAGALLTFGGHKGSAVSTMVELLAGAMIGDLTSPEALAHLGAADLLPRHGELILAFDPRVFAAGRPGDPFARAETLIAAIAGQGARLPSERRFAARARSLSAGIWLSAAERAELDRFQRLGLDAVG